MKSSSVRFVTFAAVIVAVLALALFVALAPSAPVAAQNTACFRPVGGASFECGDGGSFVVGDGAQLVVESGGTLVMDGYTTGDVTTLNVSGESKLTGATWITGTLTGAEATLASINVTGNGDVTGNFEVTDHLLTQAEFYMIPPAAVTVADGGTINPTGAVVELTAAGDVGAQMDAAGDGEFVILINTVNQTITITDTGSAKLAGDYSMGQYDTLTLIGQGVIWHEVSRSNN